MLGRIRGALERPARSRNAYLAAGAIGLAVYLLVFGIGHPLGTSDYWDLPMTDHRAYMMGYRYFLHEPWQWPVFVVQTMNVPFEKSIAFSDAIPIWAFVNKSIATIIPPWGEFSERAYLGLWYLVLYVLQPLLAVANLRALGQKSWAATIATALLFVAAPAWTNRYVHASMSAHFLTLWALLLYLRTPSRSAAPRSLRAHQLVQLGVATLVNPYHAMMSYGFFVASVLRTWNLRQAAIWLPAGFAPIAAGAWFASYFAKEAALKMFGFEVASTNVLSFVMPYQSNVPDVHVAHSALFGDSLNVDPTGFQYEGAAFAGLGMLVLLALFVPRVRSLPAVIKRHRFLFVIALGAWVFALSTHIWIGGFQLVTYSLPSKLGWLADQFRSPGRFVWVPMYVAMVFLAKEALAHFRGGWKLFIVPVLGVLQLVDGTSGWSKLRANTRGPDARVVDKPRIDLAAWRPLVRAHEQVYVYPSYDCVLDGTKDMDYVSLDIEYLASELALPINGVYSARPTRDCAFDHTLLMVSAPHPRTLYVLLRREQESAHRFVAFGATCGEFAYGRVCSLDKAAIDAALAAKALSPMPPAPAAEPLALGTTLVTTAATPAGFFDFGWSWPDEHGRFTDGSVARLKLALTGSLPERVRLTIHSWPVICGRRRSQVLNVTVNGTWVGTVRYADDQLRTDSFVIPRSALSGPITYLELWPRDYRPLHVVGCNADTRALGVSVRDLRFE